MARRLARSEFGGLSLSLAHLLEARLRLFRLLWLSLLANRSTGIDRGRLQHVLMVFR